MGKEFKEYTIRTIKEQEYSLLNDFLYEAIFIPDGIEPPPKNVIASPELQIYVDRFGTLEDDYGLVAEVEERLSVPSGFGLLMITDTSTINPPPLQSLCIRTIGDTG